MRCREDEFISIRERNTPLSVLNHFHERRERSLEKIRVDLYEVEMTGTKVMPEGMEGSEYQVGYLEDGDEVVLEGWCEDGSGRTVLGFGECRGRIAAPKK
jgi:hypothetical protein